MAVRTPAQGLTGIEIGVPKKTKDGQRLCIIGASPGGDPVYLQTPALPMPWALDSKYGYLSLSMDGWNNPDAGDSQLYKWLSDLDEMVLATATTQAFKWFGEPFQRDELENLYDPLVRRTSNYAPTLQAKTDAATAWFDEHGSRVSGCPGQGEARVIVQPCFVYFRSVKNGNQQQLRFGVSCKVRRFDLVTRGLVRAAVDFGDLQFVE